MNLLRELNSLREAAMKDAIMAAIDQAIEKTKEDRKHCNFEGAIEKIVAMVRKMDNHDSSKMSDEALYDLVCSQYDEDMHEHNIQMEAAFTDDEPLDSGDVTTPAPSTTPPEPTPTETKVIAHAAEFKVELDPDEQVHLVDGQGSVRVSMPLVIWRQLSRGM